MSSKILFLLKFLVMDSLRIWPGIEAWPSGTYGLPKSNSGCPRTWDEGWLKQDMENDHPYKSNFSIGLHMEATITNNDIKRYFCIKTTDDEKNKQWPLGSYCIYKKSQCPSGMQSGFVSWDDEDYPPTMNNRGGTLPDGEYRSSLTRIYYCCQDQGRWYNAIEFPVEQPFYLLPYNSSNCQRVKWAVSSLEYITYDTEDDQNIDSFQGHHVFSKKLRSLPRLYYCYYTGCRHKLHGDEGNFSSIDFPDYQYCSWKISVKESLVVSLSFTSLSVPDCDKNFIDIYNGANDTTPLLAKYCGSNATAGDIVRTTGHELYLVLKSGYNPRSSGKQLNFHAVFKAVSPRTLISWPSGTYGLAKASSGCPKTWVQGWRQQDMENTAHRSSFSPNFHMEATLTNDHINKTFCMKTIQDKTINSWPKGSYCVYKKFKCPSGMKDGSIKWDDEDNNNKNSRNGNLPDGIYDDDTKIFYCCQDDGQWYNSIQLPVEQPFYLLPYKSPKCQRVKWAVSALEYIVFDTEDVQNFDSFDGYHVFTDKEESFPKIYYCYYAACQNKISGDSGSFSSQVEGYTNYPDFQYCSWLVAVRPGLVVALTFTFLVVPDCHENYIDIYDGENERFPLLTRYCGSNATSGSQLKSTGNSVFVVVKSGNNSRYSTTRRPQFNVKYKTDSPATTTSKTTSVLQSTMTLFTTKNPGKSNNQHSGDNQQKSPPIIAIILPVLAVLLFLIVALAILFKRRRKEQKKDPVPEAQNPFNGSARYGPASGVTVEQNGETAWVTSIESENPVYESGGDLNSDPIYCTINDRTNEPVYETPVVQGNPASHYNEPRSITSALYAISPREDNTYDVPVSSASQKS